MVHNGIYNVVCSPTPLLYTLLSLGSGMEAYVKLLPFLWAGDLYRKFHPMYVLLKNTLEYGKSSLDGSTGVNDRDAGITRDKIEGVVSDDGVQK